jgi:hypothetical protein
MNKYGNKYSYLMRPCKKFNSEENRGYLSVSCDNNEPVNFYKTHSTFKDALVIHLSSNLTYFINNRSKLQADNFICFSFDDFNLCNLYWTDVLYLI